MCAWTQIIEHKDSLPARQRELFRREIEAMTTVNDAHVLKLRRVVPSVSFPHEDGRGRQVLLLELEYCSGGELFDYVLHGERFCGSCVFFSTRTRIHQYNHRAC